MKSAWKSLLTLFHKTRDTEELAHLLEFFLTPEEKNDLAHRYEIIQALLENKLTQREIAEQFNVSIAKITRGSNALKVLDPKLKVFLENHV